ncbi:MAG: DUF2759 family protein [Bacillaceae bacterium]|nr:DUF2759 family protein [Bacillaceae bacterium]
MMEVIMFLITIVLLYSTVRQFREQNKFGAAFTLISFIVFAVIDIIILYEMFSSGAQG